MLTGIQRRIALVTELSEGFISGILSGKRRPSWKSAKRLGEATFTEPLLWLEGSPKEMRAALNNLEVTYTITKKGNGQKKSYIISK